MQDLLTQMEQWQKTEEKLTNRYKQEKVPSCDSPERLAMPNALTN
jgi:hypothetical protein